MIKLKHSRQSAGMCGPASLKMILNYYGVSVSEKTIAKIAGASEKKGCSIKCLARTAKRFGLKTFLKENSSLKDLRIFIKRKIPVIVDWFFEDDGHYSVAIGINSKNITVLDPAFGKNKGRRKMPLKQFLRVWFDFPGEFIKKKKDIKLRALLAITPRETPSKIKCLI